MTKGVRTLYAVVVLGLILAIGTCFVVGAKASTEEKAKNYKYYTTVTVEEGDTLQSIADEYRDSHYANRKQYMNEVVSVNCMSSTKVYPGMTLRVPYYSAEYK